MSNTNNLFKFQTSLMHKFKLFATVLLISILFFACIKMEDTTIQGKKVTPPAPVRTT